MYCRKCGAEIGDNDKFCMKCGQEQFRICPGCQKKISIHCRFCKYCGQSLTENAASPEPSFPSPGHSVKIFAFSDTMSNEKRKDEVLSWLQKNNVIIHNVKAECGLLRKTFGKSEIALKNLSIVYEEDARYHNYMFDFLPIQCKSEKAIDTIDKEIRIWTSLHPQHKIIWEFRYPEITNEKKYIGTVFLFAVRDE